MKNKLLLIYCWFVRMVLYFLPDVPAIMRFRGWLYSLGMPRAGKNFQVTHNAILKDLQNIEVGKDIFIGNSTVIMGSGRITISDQVLIGPNVVIISGNHTSKNSSYRYGKSQQGIIEIGRGAWIAANSTVGINSKLPDGSVLSANSFLNKRYTNSNSLYGGVPAKILRIND